MKKKIKKTVIFVSYQCNNNCIFCVNSDKRSLPGRNTAEIKKDILEAKKNGSLYIEFIGGEVTIRPDAVDLILFASKLGFTTISLTTNGRMFSYLSVAEKFIKAGLTDLIFSIHGHNEKLHDRLTGSPGSFLQMLEGINNLKKLKFKNIGSNTTIVKDNYKYLPEIGKFIFDLGIRNSEFIFVDPNQGIAKRNFTEIVPKISIAAPFIKKCLDIGKTAGHWHIRYVPLCFFQKYLDQISELDEVKKFMTEHLAQDFRNTNVELSRPAIGRVKCGQCELCKLNSICEGIWKEYARKFGLKELTPIK